MTITVKLFANFRQDRFKEKDCEFPAATTCGDVIKSLDIPEEELGIILLNARHASVDSTLKEGDTLSLFPLVGGG